MKRLISGIVTVVILALGGYTYVHHSSRILSPDPSIVAPFKVHPSARGGGLRSADEAFWGASGGKGNDGRYHLYVSRMGRHCGLNAWDLNSEIVRAVSDHPLGPYKVVETVVPVMGHNPTIPTRC